MRWLPLALAIVPGCALLPAPPGAPAPAPQQAAPVSETPVPVVPGSDLMGYLARLRTLNETQLAAEIARQRRGTDDASRVRAAMAMTLAHAEEAEILALVEPVARRTAAPAEVRTMAGFLQVMAADRRRLRESAAAAGARLRDERRAQEAMKQKADAALERAAQLQQKLDALTEIERSLSDRPPPSR